jgi:hypothetical protein
MRKAIDSSDNFSNTFDYIQYLNNQNKSSESITEIQSTSSEHKSRNNSLVENDYMYYEGYSDDEVKRNTTKTVPIPIRQRETTFEGTSILDARYLTPTPTFYMEQLQDNMLIIKDLVNEKLQNVISKK